MNIEIIRRICSGHPFVTEDIKWTNDLCFSVGGKMFCVATLTEPIAISLKVKAEEFIELTNLPGIMPAPYVAKHKWILVTDLNRFSTSEWEQYIWQSYELVKSKLPQKLLNRI